MKLISMTRIWLRVRRSFTDMLGDRRGVAAIEFSLIVPVMLVAFFGTVEFSSGVAVDRKVTLIVRTLADLTSQSQTVTSADFAIFFNVGTSIMTPYSPTPVNATISELYVDPVTLKARVEWSQGAAPRATSSPVTIPTALAVAGTYLVFTEVSYLYTPTVGYVMGKAGVTLSDVAYARPRQSTCVFYLTAPAGNPPPCPVL